MALLETFPVTGPTQTIQSQNWVAPITPVYVGNWLANPEWPVRCHYFRQPVHDPAQDRHPLTQGAMPQQNVFLGVVSGDPIDFFDVPVYPVGSIPQVYVDQGLNHLFSGNFT